MKTKSNIVSLLLLCLITLSIVRAQEGTPVVTISSTSILPPSAAPTPTASAEQKCLEQCAEDDVGCRAKCAGVPNPTEQQVNETKTCLDTCIPSDPSYLACRNSCIETFYNPKQTTTPSASAPMASASTGPSSTAKTPKGKNPSPSGSVAVKTSPFGSVFASLSAFIVVFMSVCCF